MRRTAPTITACILTTVGLLASPVGGIAQDRERAPRVHDPSAIVQHKGEYWVFATGRGVSSLRSKDLVRWEPGPAVLPTPPEWVHDIVPGHRGRFWAPDVIRLGDRYLVYYSVSAFGKNTSAIALASNSTLDPDDRGYRWKDEGIVIRSTAKDDYNAIDPGLIRCRDGTLWMAFGSFWSGIKLVQLDPRTGQRIAPDSPLHALAHKEQIEAAAIHEHDGHFYLFLNWGWCCRGTRSTYEIRVGRSKAITGPYLDKEGNDLGKGGGSLLLETEGPAIGPGHPSVFEEGGRHLLSFHFYDGDDRGRSKLSIRPLKWGAAGWPEMAGKPILPSSD